MAKIPITLNLFVYLMVILTTTISGKTFTNSLRIPRLQCPAFINPQLYATKLAFEKWKETQGENYAAIRNMKGRINDLIRRQDFMSIRKAFGTPPSTVSWEKFKVSWKSYPDGLYVCDLTSNPAGRIGGQKYEELPEDNYSEWLDDKGRPFDYMQNVDTGSSVHYYAKAAGILANGYPDASGGYPGVGLNYQKNHSHGFCHTAAYSWLIRSRIAPFQSKGRGGVKNQLLAKMLSCSSDFTVKGATPATAATAAIAATDTAIRIAATAATARQPGKRIPIDSHAGWLYNAKISLELLLWLTKWAFLEKKGDIANQHIFWTSANLIDQNMVEDCQGHCGTEHHLQQEINHIISQVEKLSIHIAENELRVSLNALETKNMISLPAIAQILYDNADNYLATWLFDENVNVPIKGVKRKVIQQLYLSQYSQYFYNGQPLSHVYSRHMNYKPCTKLPCTKIGCFNLCNEKRFLDAIIHLVTPKGKRYAGYPGLLKEMQHIYSILSGKTTTVPAWLISAIKKVNTELACPITGPWSPGTNEIVRVPIACFGGSPDMGSWVQGTIVSKGNASRPYLVEIGVGTEASYIVSCSSEAATGKNFLRPFGYQYQPVNLRSLTRDSWRSIRAGNTRSAVSGGSLGALRVGGGAGAGAGGGGGGGDEYEDEDGNTAMDASNVEEEDVAMGGGADTTPTRRLDFSQTQDGGGVARSGGGCAQQ